VFIHSVIIYFFTMYVKNLFPKSQWGGFTRQTPLATPLNSWHHHSLSGWVSYLIVSDVMQIGLFATWSLYSLLGCQRPFGCSRHVQCHCSNQKFHSRELLSLPLPLFANGIILIVSDSTDLGWECL